MAINVLFAVVAATGLMVFVFGLTQRRMKTATDLEEIAGTGELQRGPKEHLNQMLADARVQVSVDQFLMVSVLLAFAGGGLAYLLSNAFLAAILGFVAGGAVYWIILTSRAAAALEAYENALPEVMARLRAGALMGGAFESAALQVAEYGPVICREDWRDITAQLRANVPRHLVFDKITVKRGSLLLNMIFEMIDIQMTQGVSLNKSLEGVQEALEERVRVMKRARTSMQGPIRELALVCAIPFLVVILLRVLAPGYSSVYSSFLGQLILLVGWGITLGAFAFGYLSFTNGLKEDTSFGGVEPEARADEPLEAREKAIDISIRSQAARQAAPGALQDILGQE